MHTLCRTHRKKREDHDHASCSRKIRLTFKKKVYTKSEQDTPRVQELRHEYRRILEQLDVPHLVFVDEAGLNLSMSRLFARAVDGDRAVGSVPGSKGGNVSGKWCFKP